MKTYMLSRAVVLGLIAILLPTITVAVPVGSRNEGMNHLFKGYALDWLSAGIYLHQIKRDITRSDFNMTLPIEMTRVTGYLGVSLAPWLTVYGVGGGNDTKVGNGSQSSGSASIYGAGVRLSLLDHRITEPVMDVDRWRLTAGVEYLLSETSYGTQTWEWQEINAALTLSIVNDLTGNKYFSPESITLYAGPYMSILDGDNFSEKTTFGALAGCEIFFTDSFSLDVRAIILDSAGMGAGFNVHF